MKPNRWRSSAAPRSTCPASNTHAATSSRGGFEFFPTKTDEGKNALLEKTIPALRQLLPDICSVRGRVHRQARATRADGRVQIQGIFRASGLSLLGASHSHVQKDRVRIRAGKALSPLLLVRVADRSKVIIADGYHRLCAVYTFDEDALIPCKIV